MESRSEQNGEWNRHLRRFWLTQVILQQWLVVYAVAAGRRWRVAEIVESRRGKAESGKLKAEFRWGLEFGGAPRVLLGAGL